MFTLKETNKLPIKHNVIICMSSYASLLFIINI